VGMPSLANVTATFASDPPGYIFNCPVLAVKNDASVLCKRTNSSPKHNTVVLDVACIVIRVETEITNCQPFMESTLRPIYDNVFVNKYFNMLFISPGD